MTKARRGSTAAFTAAGIRGQLRRQLLQLYDVDPEFGAALVALWLKRGRRLRLVPDWRSIPPILWVEEPAGHAVRDAFELRADATGLAGDERSRAWTEVFAPLADYLDGLAELATRFGIDRLGIEGVDAIHTWCYWHQEAVAVGGRWPRRRFSDGYQNFGQAIDVGEVVERDLGVLEVGGVRIAVKEQDVIPVLDIAGRTARWNPTTEPRAVAFIRLRKRFGKRYEREIRAELDRMAALAEEAGATAMDKRPNVDRDLEWLFWHLRYRESSVQVTERAGRPITDVALVRKAVWRMARDTEIALYPNWADWSDGEVR